MSVPDMLNPPLAVSLFCTHKSEYIFVSLYKYFSVLYIVVEANSCSRGREKTRSPSAGQEIPPHFVEPEGSLP
jgi:hypothetical protein